MNNYIHKFMPWILVTIISVAAFVLMLTSSRQESAVMDELAHIPAGYGYVKYLDYRLNPEHPPLVKAISALPLLFQSASWRINFPTDKASWQTDINGQWQAGAQFLYESGNNADQIIQWARLGPMLLTILLIILIYIWGKELIGRWWALLPTYLFGLSPAVLAHGHYVTTDIGAALGIFLSGYYFIKFLMGPNRRHLIFAGLAFGVAQLLKFSAVLLIPFFGFLIIVFCIREARNGFNFFKSFGRQILNLIVVFSIGYALVYAVYFVFTFNYPVQKQASDTQTILASYSGGPDPEMETCKLNSSVPLLRRARCLAELDIKMSQSRILRPAAEYMLGVLMVSQRATGGNTSYFLGDVSASGWWYYFPVVFGLKETLPSLILIALAFIFGFWRMVKNANYKLSNFSDYLGTHFPEFSMLVFVIFYWAYSVKSPLNIGVRHILPTLPFIYILTAGSLKKWMNKSIILGQNSWMRLLAMLSVYAKLFLKWTFIGFLLVWFFAETMLVFPYFISYFNQIGGGTENGYKYVTDSNYDWGQDLKRLADFAEEKNIDKIAVDYFGGGDPRYYMGNKTEYWWSAKGNPKDQNIGWLAVSINTLQNAFGALAPGQQRNPQDEYRWLKDIKNPYQPDYKAGTSIFIYKL